MRSISAWTSFRPALLAANLSLFLAAFGGGSGGSGADPSSAAQGGAGGNGNTGVGYPRLLSIMALLLLLSSCGGGGSGGSPQSSSTPPTGQSNPTPTAPEVTVNSSTVAPLSQIPLTVTNDNPSASYTAKITIGSGVSYTIAAGASHSKVVTIAAPPGILQSLSSATFGAGSFTVALGWPDSTGTVQYGSPVTLQISALPTAPSGSPPGTVYLAYLKATKEVLLQATTNLMSIQHKTISVGGNTALQATNKAVQSIDAMIAVVNQLQAAGASGSVQIGTANGNAATLNWSSLSMLDELSAAQMSSIQAIATATSSKATIRTKAQERWLHRIASQKDSSTGGSSCALDDPQCFADAIAAGAQNAASAVGDATEAVCGIGAVALLAASTAPEVVATVAIVGVAASFGTTAVGTAVSAAIEGGTDALLNGTASPSSLLPSVDYFATSIVKNAVSALTDLPLENAPAAVQAAYDIGQAAESADQSYSDLTTAFSGALQSGDLPSSPVSPGTYSLSMTEDPSTLTYNVTLSPAPAGNTTLTFEQSDSATTIDSTQVVTATNGTASFTAAPVSGALSGNVLQGDINVASITDSTGTVTATTDYDYANSATSDTQSFASPNSPTSPSGGGGSGGSSPSTQTYINYSVGGVAMPEVDPCSTATSPSNSCFASAGSAFELILKGYTSSNVAVSGSGMEIDIYQGSAQPVLSGAYTGMGSTVSVGAAITSATFTATIDSNQDPLNQNSQNPNVGSAAFQTSMVAANPPAGYPSQAYQFSDAYLEENPSAQPGTVTFTLSTIPASGASSSAPYGQVVAQEYLSGSFDFWVSDPEPDIQLGNTIGPHEVKGTFNADIGQCSSNGDGKTMSCPL